MHFISLKETARQIVKLCPNSPIFNPSPSLGVNLRGLRPNAVWQMDVTLSRTKNESTYFILACLLSPYVFLFTNDCKRLNI